jgi:hypothetical protein
MEMIEEKISKTIANGKRGGGEKSPYRPFLFPLVFYDKTNSLLANQLYVFDKTQTIRLCDCTNYAQSKNG